MAAQHPALSIHCFADCRALGRRVARRSGALCQRFEEHRFPDGETLLRVKGTPGRRALVLRSLHDPNTKLIEVVLAADALRRAGATTVGLIAPYLPYMRQDILFHPGQPISQRAIGEMLGHAFDEVWTVEAHLHRIDRLSEVFPCKAHSIPAAQALAKWVAKRPCPDLLVGPDEESLPWIRDLGELSGIPWVVGHKRRAGDIRVLVSLPSGIKARRALIIDDIASSGGTIATTARGLRKAGVEQIDAAVVHAIFARGALERIRRAGVERIVSCDSVPHESNAIRLDELIANQL